MCFQILRATNCLGRYGHMLYLELLHKSQGLKFSLRFPNGTQVFQSSYGALLGSFSVQRKTLLLENTSSHLERRLEFSD